MTLKLVRSPGETRLNDQLARVLSQKKGPDAVAIAVLSIALMLGLIGFAVHVLWIVAVIVMALGLGFAVANNRRDRIDAVNQLLDEESAPAADQKVRATATRR